MRKSLTVLAAVPWLLIATGYFTCGSAQTPTPAQPAPPSSRSAEQSVLYVEIIQLDAQTQLFRGQLVDVLNKKVLLEITGKGTQLQDFKNQSAQLAPRERTLAIAGPLASTVDIIAKPPIPPGPTGDDLMAIAGQMVQSYEATLPQFPAEPVGP